MKRLLLLKDKPYSEDHVLETDTMRFVAIIGIVFWIIFSVVKSIPLHTAPVDFPSKRSAIKDRTEPLPLQQDIKDRERNERQGKSQKIEEPFPDRDGPEMKAPGDLPEIKMPPLPKRRGLTLEFRSLEDLLSLMNEKKVQVYCRAKTEGFDLFFAGHPNGKKMFFKRSSSLPDKLWEITSGKDHDYFLNLIMKAYPTVSRFPHRQVLISFSDTDLENRLDRDFRRLQRKGIEGILSISRNGNVAFEEFDHLEKRNSKQ